MCHHESSSETPRLGVTFCAVQVREYELRLGDNPAVSNGLPVTLGDQIHSETFDFESYEECEKRGTSKKATKLSKQSREEIIRDRHTRSSINRARQEIRKIQSSRQQVAEQAEAVGMGRTHSYPAPFFVRWMRGCKDRKAAVPDSA